MRSLALAPALLALAACTTMVAEPVPDPLPEALPWRARDAGGAYLGLKTTENDGGSLEDLFFDPGVRVQRVVENSPAAAAGVLPGDVVLSLDGRAVDDPSALDALVLGRTPGDRVRLEVRRADTVFGVDVELAARAGGVQADAEPLYVVDRARSGAGWATDLQGVRLVSAAKRGPVARAEIPLGSVVTALDREPVASDRELVRRLLARDAGDEVRFDFVRPDGSRGRAEVELYEAETWVAGWSVPVLAHYSHDPEGPSTEFALIDLWLLCLLEYQREGKERTWTLLSLFSFSSGRGELDS